MITIAAILLLATVIIWRRAYRLVGIVRGTQLWADAAAQTYAFHLYEHPVAGRSCEAVGVEFSSMTRTRPEFVAVVQPWMDGLPLAQCYRVNAKEGE